MLKITHINRHRLCPAEFEGDHHDKAEYIDMFYGIERKPAHVFGRIISQLVGNKAVAQLMQRYAHKRRYYRHEYFHRDRPVEISHYIAKRIHKKLP